MRPGETGNPPTRISNPADDPTDVPAFPARPSARYEQRRADPARTGNSLPPVSSRAALLEGVLCGIDTSLAAVNVPKAGYDERRKGNQTASSGRPGTWDNQPP